MQCVIIRGRAISLRSAKSAARFLLISLILFFFTACQRQAAESSAVSVKFAGPDPVKVGPANIRLELKNSASKPLSGVHIQLEADMAHPGMAPEFAEMHEAAPGQYDGAVNITMPGDWVLLVHGTLPDGKKLERQFEMKGVQAN